MSPLQQKSLQPNPDSTALVLVPLAELPANQLVCIDDYEAAKPDGSTYPLYERTTPGKRRQVGYWGFGADLLIFTTDGVA